MEKKNGTNGKRHVGVRRRMVNGTGLLDNAAGGGFSGRVGSNHHSAILDEKSVAKARTLMRTGQYMTKDLAEQFGVSRSCMRHALVGKTWGHVETPPVEGRLGALMDPPGPETRHRVGMDKVQGNLPPYVADWLRTQRIVPNEGLFSIIARFVREKADESYAKILRREKVRRVG